MELEMDRVAECVFDITTVACSVIFQNPKYQDVDIDSRWLFNNIYLWAQEFERETPEPDDYILEIEMFAYRKLKGIGYEPLGGENDADCI